MKLRISNSLLKTDYIKSLYDENVYDLIDVDIDIDLNVDEHFIDLYFNIQENLQDIIKSVHDYDGYDLLYIMKLINNFFYPKNGREDKKLLPFEVAVFLIKAGYKEYFLSDSYYLSLLYETPEIYNRIITDNYCRDNNISQELIEYENDQDNIKYRDINKYDKYTISTYPIKLYDNEIDLLKKKTKYIKEEYELLMNNYRNIIIDLEKDISILEILSIKGICICGDYVDNLFYVKLYNNTNEYSGSSNDGLCKKRKTNLDIFFYGVHNEKELSEKLYQIVEIIHKKNNNIYISHSDKYIKINGFESKLYRYKLKIQIRKKIYGKISDILLETDIDSHACCLYIKNKDEINISYLPRYKFALENRINIINPYGRLKSFNKRLLKECEKGYRIFIPGCIHLTNNYLDRTKSYPKDTLQELFNGLLSYNKKRFNNKRINEDEVKDKKYNYNKKYKYIFNISNDNINNTHTLLESNIDDVDNFLIEKAYEKGENFTIVDLIEEGKSPYGIYFKDFKYLHNILTLTKITSNWEIYNSEIDKDIINKFDYLSMYNINNHQENQDNKYIQTSVGTNILISID